MTQPTSHPLTEQGQAGCKASTSALPGRMKKLLGMLAPCTPTNTSASRATASTRHQGPRQGQRRCNLIFQNQHIQVQCNESIRSGPPRASAWTCSPAMDDGTSVKVWLAHRARCTTTDPAPPAPGRRRCRRRCCRCTQLQREHSSSSASRFENWRTSLPRV